jgi:hypothetical protein
MKRCAWCQGQLGLGVRSRNLWDGRWWIHVRYCSTHCEALHELERRERQTIGTPPGRASLLSKKCLLSWPPEQGPIHPGWDYIMSKEIGAEAALDN